MPADEIFVEDRDVKLRSRRPTFSPPPRRPITSPTAPPQSPRPPQQQPSSHDAVVPDFEAISTDDLDDPSWDVFGFNFIVKAILRLFRRTKLFGRRLRVYAIAFWVKRQYDLCEKKCAKLPRATKGTVEQVVDATNFNTRRPETNYQEEPWKADGKNLPVHPDYEAEETAIYDECHARMADLVGDVEGFSGWMIVSIGDRKREILR